MTHLTSSEILNRHTAQKGKVLSVFDLDDTIVHGDTSSLWRDYLIEQGYIKDPQGYIAQDNAFNEQYKNGVLNLEANIEFNLLPIKDLPLPQVQELVMDCIHSKVMPRVNQEALVILQSLLAKSTNDVMMISASNSYFVHIMAKVLGIHHSIGVDLALDENNCLTPKVIGTPSFKAGKVTRLREWLQENDAQYSYKYVTFYTDSINDLPLCEYANTVYAVNPCPKLKQIALLRNWDVLHWSPAP